MRTATNALIVASFLWFLASFWNRNDLPGHIDYVNEIADEPRQKNTDRQSFEAVWNDVRYTIHPQYDYDIVGMIVSYRHHDNNSRMHRLADDHLNMLDVCVIWGDNAGGAQLDKLSFWNGIFTCNVKTRDRVAWESFDMNQMSNNHLISDDEYIRDSVRNIRVGDQIRIQGVLASYVSPGGERGTSTTRTDTGDGACETIFVDRFEVIRPARNMWRTSMYLSLACLAAGLIVFFSRPFKAHRV